MLRKEYSNSRPAQATYQVQGQPGIHNRPYLQKKEKRKRNTKEGKREKWRRGSKGEGEEEKESKKKKMKCYHKYYIFILSQNA